MYVAQFWSDVAHLGGAAMAAVWIWVLPRFRGRLARARARADRGAWERKMRRRAAEMEELDRILDKVHREGLASLTAKEKRTLREATEKQRDEERDLYRP